MVNAVTSGGYQAYSYQQAVNPQVEAAPRGGENRIQQRPNPVGDSQRSDQREASSRDSRDTGSSARSSSRAEDTSSSRGRLIDVTA